MTSTELSIAFQENYFQSYDDIEDFSDSDSEHELPKPQNRKKYWKRKLFQMQLVSQIIYGLVNCIINFLIATFFLLWTIFGWGYLEQGYMGKIFSLLISKGIPLIVLVVIYFFFTIVWLYIMLAGNLKLNNITKINFAIFAHLGNMIFLWK